MNIGFVVLLCVVVMTALWVTYKLQESRLEVEKLSLQVELEKLRSVLPAIVEDHSYQDEEEPISLEEFEPKATQQMFALSQNVSVAKDRLIAFVHRSFVADGPRLGIGKWREEGWTQMELEALLDLMHSKGLCTKRTAGSACIYTNTSGSPEYVLRILST